MNNKGNQMILFKTEDNKISVDVRFDEETAWLTLDQMAELFERDKSTISRHIKNVFSDGELERDSVVANFATTAADGKTYQVDYYNLDVIISVGYRVKSLRGTQFRRWATRRLNEYIRKGFTMDDERLKNGGGRYFRELLQRIRDIRSSERNLYQQVTDIYATAIDYDPKAPMTREFFATVQNKMHYAAHKHTAAEVIYERVYNKKPMIGMTNFKGEFAVKSDVRVAKNYLTAKVTAASDIDKENINDDIEFEIELIRQVEVNIDYILMLIAKYHASTDKEILIDIQKAVDASLELRSKKELIEGFISRVNIGSDIDDEWQKFVLEQKEADLDAIIQAENLKPVEAKYFMNNCFCDGVLKDVGTDIDKILPPISRFGGGNRTKKKQDVIGKLMKFFEKYTGLV